MTGLGIWQPDTQTLNKIRDAIVENPDEWIEVSRNESFTEYWILEGSSLKRAPKGYDINHPLIVDLRRKDFVAATPFTIEQVWAPDFIDHYTEVCQRGAPFMKFITTALGLAW
ncbi:DUF2461 family protein [Anaerolineales bacterium HSG6]|nr:DUF2461 family protein [Anaerolineales bacterium HSG6]